MTVALDQEYAQSDFLKINLVGNAVAAGLVGQVLNPEGQALFIIEGYLYFEVASTLTSTFNIGVGAEDADASDLMSAMAMDKTAGTVWQVVDKDTASEAQLASPGGLAWAADAYLTVTSAAQVSTGLKAVLLLKYLRLADLAQ